MGINIIIRCIRKLVSPAAPISHSLRDTTDQSSTMSPRPPAFIQPAPPALTRTSPSLAPMPLGANTPAIQLARIKHTLKSRATLKNFSQWSWREAICRPGKNCWPIQLSKKRLLECCFQALLTSSLLALQVSILWPFLSSTSRYKSFNEARDKWSYKRASCSAYWNVADPPWHDSHSNPADCWAWGDLEIRVKGVWEAETHAKDRESAESGDKHAFSSAMRGITAIGPWFPGWLRGHQAKAGCPSGRDIQLPSLRSKALSCTQLTVSSRLFLISLAPLVWGTFIILLPWIKIQPSYNR